MTNFEINKLKLGAFCTISAMKSKGVNEGEKHTFLLSFNLNP